jgi:hypothetical protein
VKDEHAGMRSMSKLDFAHFVEVDEESRQIKIYRIFPDGKKQLYTQIEIPSQRPDATLDAFSRMLGENLLLDSPIARRILGL